MHYFEKKKIEKKINNEIEKIISNMNKIIALKKEIGNIFLFNVVVPGFYGKRVISVTEYEKSPPPEFEDEDEDEEGLYWLVYDPSNYGDYLKYEELDINELNSVTIQRLKEKLKKDIKDKKMLRIKEKIKKEKTIELSYDIGSIYKKYL